MNPDGKPTWTLRFTREMSLCTYSLIARGFRGMRREFGDAPEYLLYVSQEGLTRAYRNPADEARFMQSCTEALTEPGLLEKACRLIGKRFEALEKKVQAAEKNPSVETFTTAGNAFCHLWNLYLLPLYWEEPLAARKDQSRMDLVLAARKKSGGSAYRKGAEGLVDELVQQVGKTLETKTGLPREWAWFATPEELAAGLEEKTMPRLRLEQRKRAWVLLQKKDVFRILAGGEAEKAIRKEIGFEKNRNETGPLKGHVAFGQGIIEGPVRVALKKTDVEKIQAGEILATAMTTPEMVPAMGRAKAIITDEGGLTCHAAILARELKIPCLVGTKHATQALAGKQRIRIDLTQGNVTFID